MSRAGGGLVRLVAAVAAACVALGGLEFAVRWSGAGAPQPGASSLRYQRFATPLFLPTEQPDLLATTDPRLPYQELARSKPPGVRRVFFFGGSALAGLGYSPNVTIPSELERLLRACGQDEGIEIYNLGVVAFASGQVRAMVSDVLRSGQPDLVVVYSGNNEFLELHSQRYAAATGHGPNALRRLIDASHLARLVRGEGELDRAVLEASVSTRDLAQNDARVEHREMLERIELTDADLDRVYAAYRENLAAIAGEVRAAGVELVLMEVASNAHWLQLEDEGEAWRGEFGAEGEALLAAVDAALTEADAKEHYRWHHRRARLLGELGRPADAAAAYRDALESDPHLRRATHRHRDAVRAVAKEAGVPVFDTAAALLSEGELEPGFAHFYDYVHFTPRGIAQVSRALLVDLARRGLLGAVELPTELPETILTRAPWERGEPDSLLVEEWIGYGLKPERVHDRDLWKYDSTWSELEDADFLNRLAYGGLPDARVTAYLGSILWFKPARREEARRLWRRALDERGLNESEYELVRANLARE